MKKNILFIGGSTGIGLETIKLLHEKCNLIVASRTNENLENLDFFYETLFTFLSVYYLC